ncbi:heparinase II/III domain-containing protein [Acetobacter fallax]|nr:heparinase II/III family protein [Acetobacter fallax]
MALLGPLGGVRSIPAMPEQTVRDPWPGNATVGELLVQGSASHAGVTRILTYARWTGADWPDQFRDWFQSFEWLRDLRELGSESARAKARAMVATWIGQPMSDTPLQDPSVTGARIAAWLSQYDFFAASADDSFRRSLMTRIVLESRTIMALLPTDRHDWTALRALKGLLAAAIALPGQSGFLARYMKLIDAELECQVLPDGCHASRSPEAQLLVLRELADMRLLLQTAKVPMPTTLAAALDRMAPVLRAFRHGDGRLALFNGTGPHRPEMVDLIIARALPRGHVLARGMPDGRFMRAASGNTVLFADGGPPPPPGFDALTHAGLMSMELSSGRCQIVVNCGASGLPAWRNALRDAPAHSVLSLPSCPPVLWRSDGHVETRPAVKSDHTVLGTDHLIELSSDCYRPAGAGTYHRRLYLAQEGTDLRGEDRLDSVGPAPEFVVRFHLHPDVKVELEDTDILLHTQEEMWCFRSDGYSSIEESVYFGGPKPTPTLQIVVRPAEILPESEEPAVEPVSDEQPADFAEGDEARSGEPHDMPEDPADAQHPDEEPHAGEQDEHPQQETTEPGQDPSSPAANEPADEPDALSPEEESPAPVTPPVVTPPVLASSIRWAFTRLDG